MFNPPLHGVRLDGLLNLAFGGPCEFLSDRLDHADSFLVLTQIDVWHPLEHSSVPFENNFPVFWVGYKPVSLCVGV